MSNIGKIIRDHYCNGYFGREYDFNNSVIIAEGNEYLVIRKENGLVCFCNFQNYKYNNDGTLSYLTCMDYKDKQRLIDIWCAI